MSNPTLPFPGKTNRKDVLLRPSGIVSYAPSTDRFIVSDNFVEGCDKGVPISAIGRKFKEVFYGSIEGPAPATNMLRRRLRKESTGLPILAIVGGHCGTRLSHLHTFLRDADRSLRTWYLSFVAGPYLDVYEIDAIWLDGGWDIEAYPRNSMTWPIDTIVVHRMPGT